MQYRKTGKKDVKSLAKRKPGSRKGENGRVLLVAGSSLYHGAAIFSGVAASRIVDIVYFATAKENLPLIKSYSPEFIAFPFSRVWKTLPAIDSALAGPGLEKSPEMKRLLHRLVTENKGKKTVLDATALRLIDPGRLHPNCAVTPHSDEFRSLFGLKPSKENVQKAARQFDCVVVLKGQTDYISDGRQAFENHTGNAGMTTGGTGDILAGLIAGFAAKNSLLLSAKAACYLNGFAADMLERERPGMWNAQDLMEKLPEAKSALQKR